VAAAIKDFRLPVKVPRPIDEAISTAGGVRFEGLDEKLMLRDLPGVFCAGDGRFGGADGWLSADRLLRHRP
jgi:predicted flavoprotein YhiN